MTALTLNHTISHPFVLYTQSSSPTFESCQIALRCMGLLAIILLYFEQTLSPGIYSTHSIFIFSDMHFYDGLLYENRCYRRTFFILYYPWLITFFYINFYELICLLLINNYSAISISFHSFIHSFISSLISILIVSSDKSFGSYDTVRKK